MAESGGRNARHHGWHRGHQGCRAVGMPCAITAQQPAWSLASDGDTVSLFADADRIVRATDSSGREALLACGALLDHFRVAMAAAGFDAKVDRLPNPDNPLHVATIDFEVMEYVTDGHRQRANAILLRRTDRLPFAAPPDWHVFEEEF